MPEKIRNFFLQFEEEVELAEDVDDVGEPGGNENGIGADPSGEPNTQFGVRILSKK